MNTVQTEQSGRGGSSSVAADPRTDWKRAVLLCAVVAAISMAVHWPALSAKTVSFDDHQYLLDNALVRHPSWNSVQRFFGEVLKPSSVAGYYQPLSMTSLMLDAAMGGGRENFTPFHRTSLILHGVNVALLTALFYQLFGSVWAAAGAGLLFGVHPLTIEPIPWIGERKTLLATAFALGAVIAYVRYVRLRDSNTPLESKARRGGAAYGLSIVLFILAALSKPTVVPLPIVLLLMDAWPLRRLGLRAILEKLPHLAIAMAFGIITIISQGRSSVATMPTEYPASRVPLVSCHNIIFYLQKMIWPSRLSSHYPFPEPMSLSGSAYLAGVVGTAVLLALLIVTLRWTRAAVVGWLIFFVAILPTMQIIGFSDVIASDKYAYWPALGVLLVIAWGLRHAATARRAVRCVTAAGVILLVAASTYATRAHYPVWKDTETYYGYMLSLTPNSAALHNNLAVALVDMKRYDDAIRHYQRAIELKPADDRALTNLGVLLVRGGLRREAIKLYEAALKQSPNSYSLHSNIGALLAEEDRLEEALEHYRLARLIKPDSVEAITNYANGLLVMGKPEEAIKLYREALEIRVDIADIHNNLAVALDDQEQEEEAIQHYELAVGLNPNHAGAQRNLAVRLAKAGRFEDAMRHVGIAVRLNPKDSEALFVMAQLQNIMGMQNDAVQSAEKVLMLDPGFLPARDLIKSIKNPDAAPTSMPELPTPTPPGS